jgi:cobalt-zinc-cadmium efflux system membrane fusion protein
MNKQHAFSIMIMGLLAVATLGVAQLTFSPAALAQEEDHTGHDHGAESERKKNAHAGHDDHGDEGDGHEGHENEAVRFDAATLKEFGIVVEEARSGAIGETIRLPGEVVFNADRVAHVTPSVAGIVQMVNQSVGDRLEAGEVMAVLSSRELAAARSEYLGAKARLALEQETLEREERLLEDRIGTQRELLEARKAVREEDIALNLAEQNLHALGQTQGEVDALDESAETVLSKYELRAPLGGLVIAREATRGEVISEQPEEPPFIVADVSSVWVNLTVYQRDLASVKPGMDVRIEFGHGIPSASGKISFVSPSLDETTRTATARIVLENEQGQWRPGLFVTGMVTSGEESAAVVVPKTALQEIEGKTAVFIQDEDGFEMRLVVLGRTGKDTVEIIRGLKAGERFVSENGFAVKAEMNKASFGDGHNH